MVPRSTTCADRSGQLTQMQVFGALRGIFWIVAIHWKLIAPSLLCPVTLMSTLPILQ